MSSSRRVNSRSNSRNRGVPSQGRAVQLFCSLALVCFLVPGAFADTTPPADAVPPAAGKRPAGVAPEPDYSRYSDVELTDVGARWETLTLAERRALLDEVKLRMARRKDADGVLTIRLQRRYGRIYNGSRYIRIETQVVRIRPGRVDAAEVQKPFGVGFERRVAVAPQGEEHPNVKREVNPDTPPVVRVTDP